MYDAIKSQSNFLQTLFILYLHVGVNFTFQMLVVWK